MLNKQITEGRLTANPELKMTPDGTSVCKFTLASPEDYKKKDGSIDTDFVECVAWREKAEFVSKYLSKGRLIIVEGRPKTRRYKDNNDVTHKVTELRVEAIYFAESKHEEDRSEPAQNYAQPSDDFTELSGDDDLPF